MHSHFSYFSTTLILLSFSRSLFFSILVRLVSDSFYFLPCPSFITLCFFHLFLSSFIFCVHFFSFIVFFLCLFLPLFLSQFHSYFLSLFFFLPFFCLSFLIYAYLSLSFLKGHLFFLLSCFLASLFSFFILSSFLFSYLPYFFSLHILSFYLLFSFSPCYLLLFSLPTFHLWFFFFLPPFILFWDFSYCNLYYYTANHMNILSLFTMTASLTSEPLKLFLSIPISCNINQLNSHTFLEYTFCDPHIMYPSPIWNMNPSHAIYYLTFYLIFLNISVLYRPHVACQSFPLNFYFPCYTLFSKL
jgi:hypothetical protein